MLTSDSDALDTLETSTGAAGKAAFPASETLPTCQRSAETAQTLKSNVGCVWCSAELPPRLDLEAGLVSHGCCARCLDSLKQLTHAMHY